MFRSFRRAFRSEPRIIFRSCVQKLQKDVQKRTHNHLQKLCSEASEGRSEANSESSSEAVFRSFRRAFRSELRIIKNVKNMQGTCDMDICPGKYTCMNQSSNKGIYKDYVKKDTQCSFKTMNIDVLGKFHKGILS